MGLNKMSFPPIKSWHVYLLINLFAHHKPGFGKSAFLMISTNYSLSQLLILRNSKRKFCKEVHFQESGSRNFTRMTSSIHDLHFLACKKQQLFSRFLVMYGNFVVVIAKIYNISCLDFAYNNISNFIIYLTFYCLCDLTGV